MPADAAVEAVLELLSSVLYRQPGSVPRAPAADEDTLPLTASERELATAIQARRGLSSATAEDLVRWLRLQRRERKP
ncbi:MAG: hypothetical protein HY944_04520 [Gemmatimonadetes bacterium]|nr:hypothetical protein [Gemmatimonadota bacterium]